MVIEWLKFKVNPQARETFIQIDAKIWTTTLAKCDGYLGKEVWIDPTSEDEIILVTRWETREQWKSISQEFLDEVEKVFAREMGENSYQLIEAGEFQVRKFLQISG